MHPAQTIPAKELNGVTIKTAIRAVFPAGFALAVESKVPCAFKPGEFVEEHVAFGCPQLERVVLESQGKPFKSRTQGKMKGSYLNREIIFGDVSNILVITWTFFCEIRWVRIEDWRFRRCRRGTWHDRTDGGSETRSITSRMLGSGDGGFGPENVQVNLC